MHNHLASGMLGGQEPRPVTTIRYVEGPDIGPLQKTFGWGDSLPLSGKVNAGRGLVGGVGRTLTWVTVRALLPLVCQRLSSKPLPSLP